MHVEHAAYDRSSCGGACEHGQTSDGTVGHRWRSASAALLGRPASLEAPGGTHPVRSAQNHCLSRPIPGPHCALVQVGRTRTCAHISYALPRRCASVQCCTNAPPLRRCSVPPGAGAGWVPPGGRGVSRGRISPCRKIQYFQKPQGFVLVQTGLC